MIISSIFHTKNVSFMKTRTNSLFQATCLTLLSFVCCGMANAQSNEPEKESPCKKVYLQSCVGFDNHAGSHANIGVQAILKNKWTASLSIHTVTMDPKNLPSDYEPGYVMVVIIPIVDDLPLN